MTGPVACAVYIRKYTGPRRCGKFATLTLSAKELVNVIKGCNDSDGRRDAHGISCCIGGSGLCPNRGPDATGGCGERWSRRWPVQGQIVVNPPAAAPAPTYPQNYPQGYPQAYPQGYPQGCAAAGR